MNTFCKSNRFDLLEKLYSGRIIIPTEVIAESPSSFQAIIFQGLSNGWIQEHTISYSAHPNQLKEYSYLSKRFGPGESAVMAIAKDINGTVGSDDMRATVNYCNRNNIPLMGTLGILYDAFLKRLLTQTDSQSILKTMIGQGYSCPISNFQDVIDWFKDGRGRKLY